MGKRKARFGTPSGKRIDPTDLAWSVEPKQQVPGSGRAFIPGLKARRAIKTHDDIVKFHVAGVFPSVDEALGDKIKHHVIIAAADKVIRLTHIRRNNNLEVAYDNAVANLVNHVNVDRANARIVTCVRGESVSALLKATKPIPRGASILTNYRNHKWAHEFKSSTMENKKVYPNLRRGKRKRSSDDSVAADSSPPRTRSQTVTELD
jgi:hypothetical protein